MLAIEAVFKSWNNPRAIIYRKLNDIPNNLGTAVNIQSMVFGNMGQTSGTGVAFTRNPSTGENKLFGEFLMNAQGEDVVAGIRTPEDISTLKDIMPEVHDKFIEITNILENHYKDMQDIEFTIEKEKLYILQTRNGKRTAKAAINIAVDLVADDIIDKKEAIMRIEPNQLDQLLHPTFEEKSLKEANIIAKGLPASPGSACGKVYFNAEEAVEVAKKGEEVILVRLETSPEDIEGMVLSQGVLTARGEMTSHAAVVARGMGKCCVAGCSEIKVDEYRNMNVRTNADNPRDAATAVKFGAEGIGLCRTEHMFFEEDRIPAVREMILSNTEEQRLISLEKLLPMQIDDFVKIFEVMEGRPVNIRLLDPPLHEFLPSDDETIEELAKSMNIETNDIKKRILDLEEFNPMLGHRGCRLDITYPEIYQMQAKAIIEAAIKVTKEGVKVSPEIMIPLVGEVKELKNIRELVIKTVENTIKEEGSKIDYTVGTMIEIPRACLTADEIAKEADFFSFGTNDLTQMTFGYSRDDAGKFLSQYMDKYILDKDPFQVLDQNGVGKLIKMATNLSKEVNPIIKLGICGEHGGEPSSVEFCYKMGLDYVSCSPFRVPIARLAAAQAFIKNMR